MNAKPIRTLLLVLALCGSGATLALAEGGVIDRLDDLIRSYLASRDASVQLAPPGQLARRYSVDLTGVVPDAVDLEATNAMAPDAMFDYFADRGPMDHTAGERPYVWFNLLRDADHFLFSNSSQFSQVAHIREFRAQLARVYAEGWSYQEFARWALESQLFLNRFPSAADRANAAFFLFLGRDSFASEVQAGQMWDGYRLLAPDIQPGNAETNPDYHVHVYDPARCNSGETLCAAELWSVTGDTPAVVIEQLVTSSMFAEATVDHYWQRFMGARLPGVDFPELRATLVRGFVASSYDVNWLVRELTTSAAYTQEMMFR